MGVMLQTFYWDCPAAEGREGKWWSYLNSRLPEIARAGFTNNTRLKPVAWCGRADAGVPEDKWTDTRVTPTYGRRRAAMPFMFRHETRNNEESA